jgi:hypothetical protein
MSQTQNLSSRNALARLTMGLSMLAYGIAKLSRNPKDNKGRLMVALGAMKAAEGTTKFCPMKAMMQQNGMNGSSSVPQVGQLMKDFANQGMGMTGGGSGMGTAASLAAAGGQAMAGTSAAGTGAGGNQASAGAGMNAGGNTGALGMGDAANMANAAANAGSGGSGNSTNSSANNNGQVKKMGKIKKAVWSSS